MIYFKEINITDIKAKHLGDCKFLKKENEQIVYHDLYKQLAITIPMYTSKQSTIEEDKAKTVLAHYKDGGTDYPLAIVVVDGNKTGIIVAD